jgi:hypothetical protein
MNDVVAFGSKATLPASLQAFAKGVQTAVADLSQAAAGGTPFLKLDRSGGGWMYGQDDTEVQEGSRWAFNPLSLEHGYIFWCDGKVLGEQMVPVSQPKPSNLPAPLGPDGNPVVRDAKGHAVGWNDQISIQLKCLNGEDAGTEVIYKGTSLGLKQAMHEYTVALFERVQNGDPALVGVTELKYSHYKHKTYGTIYKPEFKFEQWLTLEGTPGESAPAEPENDQNDTPAPEAPQEPQAAAQAAEPAATEAGEVDNTSQSQPAEAPQEGAATGTVRRRRRRPAA